MPGYNGKILHVDLTSQSITIEEPPDSFYRLYGGGSAMGTYYLLKDMPAGADPLGPDNMLTIFTGPPTGAAVSGQSRVSAIAKSPVTGGIGDAQAGGFWPATFKRTGFDGIVIRGKSETPVYDFGEILSLCPAHLRQLPQQLRRRFFYILCLPLFQCFLTHIRW